MDQVSDQQIKNEFNNNDINCFSINAWHILEFL